MTDDNPSSRLQIPAILGSPKSSILPKGTKLPKVGLKESKIKIVTDTNVYLSGIIFGGNPRKVLKLARNKIVVAYTSASILLEVAEKLNQKFHWDEEKVGKTLKAISKVTEVINPATILSVVKKDKSDNKIIECALGAQANYIVSRDKHLLDFSEFEGIKIVTPRDFLRIVKSQS